MSVSDECRIRYSKKSIKEKFFTVSPLVRSLMTDPQSGDARYILSQGQRMTDFGPSERANDSGQLPLSSVLNGSPGRGGATSETATNPVLAKSRQQLFREALQRAEKRLAKRRGLR